MPTIRDFIYLDFQRLRSFASQLLDDGVPGATTKSETNQAEVGGDIRGRVPMLIEGGANTKAVLSATSTVTSEIHHRLIERVLDGLERGRLLWPEGDLDDAPDGAFVRLASQIQISDPDSLRNLVAKMPDLSRAIAAAMGTTEPVPSRADKRAGRRVASGPSSNLSRSQAEGIAALLDTFTPGTVRLRLVRDGAPIGTAVVERDKFVEDLDRLVRRHGYLTGGDWETLAQVNTPSDPNLYAPSGTSIMDVIERDMLGPLKSLGDVSGTSEPEGIALTPLAIYRVIRPRDDP